MSNAPLYNLRLGEVWVPTVQKVHTAYTLDRVPQGELANHVVLQDGTQRCGPCGSAPSQAERVHRYAIKLPIVVQTKYAGRLPQDVYVDTDSLPGMLTWLLENGYDTVDMRHVTEPGLGIWIQYTDIAEGAVEFGAGSRGAEAKSAAPTPVTVTKAQRVAATRSVRTIGRRRM